VFFSVYKENQLLAKKKLQMVFQSDDVSKISLSHPFVGKYFVPKGKSNLPAVIVLGGSGGGLNWSEQVAAVLASRGFAAIAVAYFDYRGRWGLPKGLANIPLELFEKVVQWLQAREEVDQQSISIVGISKGGELALLLASYFPQYFDKVVAYVPSLYVFQGIQIGETEKVSSWSYQGKPLAFVPYPKEYRADWNFDKSTLREIHLRAMQNKEALEQARIPIERMKCHLLLISGDLDALGPTSEMCEEIVDSLKKCQYPYTVRHLRYQEAGHGFFIPNLPPVLIGSKDRVKPIAIAERDAWRKMIDFLQETPPLACKH
jgi:dienelactone hydrolase